VKHATTLEDGFPVYLASSDYVHPLSQAGQQEEATAVSKVTPAAYEDYLKKITSLKSRSWQSADATASAVSLVKAEFDALGFKTCEHLFHKGSRSLTNVLAYLPGRSLIADTILVGAHYDSRPFDGAAPGAVDNGSGVAGMLAMAKALKASGFEPWKPVLFAAFAGEEAGLLGSEAFAKELTEGGGQAIPKECRPASSSSSSFMQSQPRSLKTLLRRGGVRHAFILDEIGWLSPNLPAHTVNLETYDSSAEMMQHMVHSSHMHNSDNLTVVHSNHPFGSDHMSFLDHKVQSVLTINGDDEKYPNYHTSQDTIENVNVGYATKITKMNMGALVRMSGVNEKAPERPETALMRREASS